MQIGLAARGLAPRGFLLLFSSHLTIVMTMVKPVTRRKMSISEFRAKCLALMDEVAETGVPIDVTRRGKIVGEFRPLTPEEARLFAEGEMEEWKPSAGGRRKRGKKKAAR